MMRIRSTHLVPKPLGIAIALLIGIAGVEAQPFPETIFQKVGDEFRLTVGELPFHYFGFQHSTNLRNFSTLDMALGQPAPTFGYLPGPGETRGFFRAEALDGWSPGDADRDGMDDMWELINDLDPLDAVDAHFLSTMHPGMTNLECYRFRFGLEPVTQFISAETSVFNSTFAISSETSVYNFPNTTGFSVEALSAEVSLFNTPPDTGPSIEVISVETSVFNAFSVQPPPYVLSHEVSVLNTLP